jgi:hypothetical protein
MSEHAAADDAHPPHHQHDHAAHHEHPAHREHPEPHRGRLRHELSHLLRPHSHDTQAKVDRAMEASAQGMRTL